MPLEVQFRMHNAVLLNNLEDRAYNIGWHVVKDRFLVRADIIQWRNKVDNKLVNPRQLRTSCDTQKHRHAVVIGQSHCIVWKLQDPTTQFFQIITFTSSENQSSPNHPLSHQFCSTASSMLTRLTGKSTITALSSNLVFAPTECDIMNLTFRTDCNIISCPNLDNFGRYS